MCKRYFLSLFYFTLSILNIKKYVRLYASGKKHVHSLSYRVATTRQYTFKIMRIAVFGNKYQKEKSAQSELLFNVLEKYGVEISICKDFYAFLVSNMNLHPQPKQLITDNHFDADIAISMGGDGTFLKTAERIGEKNIPILGINTGRLGFLADVAPHEIENTISEIINGKYHVEERTLLQLQTKGLSTTFYPYALNEIAISKRDSSSMLTIHTYLDNNYLNAYQADGLIIATPTGSTAYSLSVGGPIIVPQAHNFVITAVAPHSLNVRPLVINDNSVIRLQVESRNTNFLIGVDGRSAVMNTQYELNIRKADYTTKVVKRPNHLFHNTLRNKLMWGADKRI